MTQQSFTLFGATHWAVLGTMAATTATLVVLVRKFPRLEGVINYSLAGILAASKLTTLYLAWQDGILTLQNGLPMHLCDWATIIVIILLIWPKQWLYEIAYFWGLAGTTQAILTPDLGFLFPDPRFFTFFISHGSVIVVILYLTIGKRMRPASVMSILRVFGATQVYIATASVVNWLCGANYGYLCAKPQNPSLLDHLGPWPWYILSIEALAVLFFLLCYAPFAVRDFFTRSDGR